MRAAAWMLPMIATTACATAAPRVQMSAMAGQDAVSCGAAALQSMGYDVKPLGPNQMEANRVLQLAPAEARRDVIGLVVTPAADPEMRMSLSAWLYQPATHSSPVNRQTVHEVAPDGNVVFAARSVLQKCGRT